jgi:general nucleoside transport system permease protein
MEVGWWGVLIAVLGGAIRIGTPFLFVSLGECLTEKSGRINLGLEGTLVMGAMTGYVIAQWVSVAGSLVCWASRRGARILAQLALQLPAGQ